MTEQLSLAGFRSIGSAQVIGQSQSGVRLAAGDTTIEVTALAPDVFRVGMFPDGNPATYASEATEAASWEAITAQITMLEGRVTLATQEARAQLTLDPLRIRFGDTSGRRFAEDDPECGMGTFAPTSSSLLDMTVGPPVRVYKRHPEGEHYFGCGERTAHLDKTHSQQLFWNIDPPVGHDPAQSNLYISIPFTLALQDGKAWGLFLDNPARTEFDLACERPDRSWFGAANGNLIYYVFAGPSPAQVLRRYTQLTGHTPMPPFWSLGYQQSRYSYMDEAEVREIAAKMREQRIPCDVIYLDIDYMDDFRVFTWDPVRFPDPARLLADLREQGFRVVTILDPGIKVDVNYPVYESGRERDAYCKTAEGEEYHNVVWPGVCAFPDFTSSRTRAWWGEQLPAVLDEGVAGIWCDMDEPALFIPIRATMPDDVVHPGDDTPRYHAQVHNLYGSLMARATREGLLSHQPQHRPFVISRAGFAGLQRHALHWTGDNNSWWQHLAMSMPQLQNLGLSGLGWVGMDIGGFVGDSTGELLTRWFEMGIFQPFCRNHTDKGTRPQEPWAFGEPYESMIRTMLLLRQRLLPYLYTLFEECHRTGAPLLRPLLYHYPDDPTTYNAEDEFLLGDAILVVPIYQPGQEYRAVYLPEGEWFHYWSGEQFTGPAHILAHAPLGRPAFYLRANTPLPLWPEMMHVGERNPDPLTWLVYVTDGAGSASLYEDEGDGYDYRNMIFQRRKINCRTGARLVTITIGAAEGAYRPPRQEVRLEIHGLERPPVAVRAGGSEWEWRSEGEGIVIGLPERPGVLEIEIERG